MEKQKQHHELKHKNKNNHKHKRNANDTTKTKKAEPRAQGRGQQQHGKSAEASPKKKKSAKALPASPVAIADSARSSIPASLGCPPSGPPSKTHPHIHSGENNVRHKKTQDVDILRSVSADCPKSVSQSNSRQHNGTICGKRKLSFPFDGHHNKY